MFNVSSQDNWQDELYRPVSYIMHLSVVCPRMGAGAGGGGSTHGKFAISGFQMSISPPLGLHFESNSHPWGELVVTHDGL